MAIDYVYFYSIEFAKRIIRYQHQQAVLAAGVVVLNTVLKNKKGVVKTVDQVAHIIMDAL